MKNLSKNQFFRFIVVFSFIICSLFIGLLISVNFIVNPIIYWLASTEIARLFIGFILSWFGVSKCFDLFYKYYKRKKRIEKFNALNIPYPRTFKGRK